MTYQLHKVEAANFGPFEEVSIRLDRPGLTVLEGQFNNDSIRADSNGAGKSMVLEAVAWCLFGKTLRPKLSPDDVVRRGSRGGASVTVWVKGEREIKVTRYRKHTVRKNTVHLEIDGEAYTPGTVAETDALIEDYLGLTFEGYCNSVAFGARVDVQSFYSSTDAEKKRLLNELLGLGVYEAAADLAKKRLRDATSLLQDIEHDLDTVTQRQEDAYDALGQAEEDLDPEGLQRKIAELTVKDQRFSKGIRQLREEQGEADAAFASAQESYSIKVRLYDEKHAAAEKLLKQRQRAVWDAQSEQSGFNSRALELDSLIRQTKEKGDTCETCGQKLDTTAREESIASMVKKRDDFKHKAVAMDIELKHHEEELELVTFPSEPCRELLEAAEDWQERCQQRIRELTQGREHCQQQLEQAKDHYDNIEAQITKLREKATELDNSLSELTEKIEPAKDDVDAYEYWTKGFGARGLQSFLIEAEMGRINKAATGHAQRLVGKGARIQLTATSTTKTKGHQREVINITASIPNCASSYEGASKGQKRRLDLSLMLAFHELLAHRTAMPIANLFVDELFDGMDLTGVETSTELLKELSEDRPVLLITHDSRLRGAADYVETIFHNGNTAAIMPQGPAKTARTAKRTKRNKSVKR